MTPESELRIKICNYLKAKGVLCFRHDSMGVYDPARKVFRTNKDPHKRKGVSDILGIVNKKFLAIECKIKGRYATKEQKEFIEDVKKHGGVGFVAYSLEDVKSVLFSKTIEETNK